jgi:hypothetical protein
MAKIKTISDKLAKRKCSEWLQKNGFEDVELAKNSSCDLFGIKNGKKYFIEVKYHQRITETFLAL